MIEKIQKKKPALGPSLIYTANLRTIAVDRMRISHWDSTMKLFDDTFVSNKVGRFHA